MPIFDNLTIPTTSIVINTIIIISTTIIPNVVINIIVIVVDLKMDGLQKGPTAFRLYFIFFEAN